MSKVRYDQYSLLISGILLVSMLIAIEVGYRPGRRNETRANESSRTPVGVIQASLLGMLALLPGFTFSLSLQRFDYRSQAVVDEANAIGTTYLRAQLLPASIRARRRPCCGAMWTCASMRSPAAAEPGQSGYRPGFPFSMDTGDHGWVARESESVSES